MTRADDLHIPPEIERRLLEVDGHLPPPRPFLPGTPMEVVHVTRTRPRFAVAAPALAGMAVAVIAIAVLAIGPWRSSPPATAAPGSGAPSAPGSALPTTTLPPATPPATPAPTPLPVTVLTGDGETLLRHYLPPSCRIGFAIAASIQPGPEAIDDAATRYGIEAGWLPLVSGRHTFWVWLGPDIEGMARASRAHVSVDATGVGWILLERDGRLWAPELRRHVTPAGRVAWVGGSSMWYGTDCATPETAPDALGVRAWSDIDDLRAAVLAASTVQDQACRPIPETTTIRAAIADGVSPRWIEPGTWLGPLEALAETEHVTWVAATEDEAWFVRERDGTRTASSFVRATEAGIDTWTETAVLPGACGIPAFDLRGTSWTVIEIADVPATGARPWFEFHRERLSASRGFDGCSEFALPVTAGSGSIAVGELESGVICAGPAAGTRSRLRTALEGAATWSVDGDTLRIEGSGGSIVASRDLPPLGTDARALVERLLDGEWRIVDLGSVSDEPFGPVVFTERDILSAGACGFGGSVRFGAEPVIAIGEVGWDTLGVPESCSRPRDALRTRLEAVTAIRPDGDRIVLVGSRGNVVLGR